MNMPTHRDESAFPEEEWHAQEQALRAERLGLSGNQDARTRDYRHIARALRQPLPDPLPADFVEHVAHRIRTRKPVRREGLECTIGAALLLVLVAAGIGYGTEADVAWWQTLGQGLPSGILGSPWLLCLAVCTGLTALLQFVPFPGRRPHL